MDPSALRDLAVAGYLVALPIVAYALIDLARIPGHLYRYTAYSRAAWIGGILIGYLGLGVGGIVMVVVWLRSAERDDLRAEWALDERWEHDRAQEPEPAAASAPALTPVPDPDPAPGPVPDPEPAPTPEPAPLPALVGAPELASDLAPEPATDAGATPPSRRLRRLERKRRHRWAIVAVTVPLGLAIVGTASRVS